MRRRDRPGVQGAHARRRGETTGSRRGGRVIVRHLHRGLAAARRPHRGTAGAHVVACGAAWERGAPDPAAHHGVEVGARRGDTKPRRSRRTLALPARAVTALVLHRIRQAAVRAGADTRWCDRDLVSASEVGTELDAANVRRGFRRIARSAGLMAGERTPRELRHSFVSLLSDAGCRSSRSPVSWVTAERRSPSRSIAISYGRSWRTGRRPWISSSRRRGRSHPGSHPEDRKGPVRGCGRGLTLWAIQGLNL